MRQVIVICGLLAAYAWVTPRGIADGGFFMPLGEVADLAQSRQEVLIAFYDAGVVQPASDHALYVLRSRYQGTPPETLAWVIPVPATPTDVVAHQNDELFEGLDEFTRPRFILATGSSSFGCGCLAADAGAGNAQSGLVVVEAQGEAGLFDWAALTSTGAGALLDWLNQNGFEVPSSAIDVLGTYIEDDMHFLAVRVREPGQMEADGDGGIAIPPIQFTCATGRRFYPMAISQVSAGAETEVLIYVLSEQRVEVADVANVTIDGEKLRYDPASESLTNYEALFAAALAESDAPVLVTEFAGSWYGEPSWVTAPPAVLELAYLTRLRTVLTPAQMDRDFEFREAESQDSVYPDYWLGESEVADAAMTLSAVSFVALTYAGFAALLKRRLFVRRGAALRRDSRDLKGW